MRHVVFDLETTGLSWKQGHKIVEIGAVEIIDGKITGNEFHAYINPLRDVPYHAYNVHKLSEQFLSNYEPFHSKKNIKELFDFLKDSCLVAHNGINFDLPFLNFELKNSKNPPIYNPIIDTLNLARYKYPGAKANLDALAERFGLSLNQRKESGHGAVLDSRLLAEIFLGMVRIKQNFLDLGSHKNLAFSRIKKIKHPGKRQKPKQMLLTKDEKNAHDKFIREQIKDSLWLKI